MCIWKNNFSSKVAFLITLLVFKKKKKSQHPCCKLCTQIGKINKTLKTLSHHGKMACAYFKLLNKTLHSVHVTVISCCSKSWGQHHRRADVHSSSSPCPVSDIFPLRGFSVHFFLFAFLFSSSCSRLSSSRSSCTAILRLKFKHTKKN